MRNNNFIFVFITLYCFFISCSNTKKQYDDKNNLTGIYSFINSNGDSIILDYTKFSNYTEKRIYHKNGEYFQTILLDSVEHGISRHFYRNKLLRKGLFYRGDLIAYESYYYELPNYIETYSVGSEDKALDSIVFPGDIYNCAVTQYRKSGNSENYRTVGNYFVKTDNTIDNRYSDYFIANVADTLTEKDSVIVNVFGNLSFTNEIKYKLLIGSVDSFSVFYNNADYKISQYNIERNKKIVLPPQKSGYHFIVGTIFIDIDNRKQQYVVFDDFIVK